MNIELLQQLCEVSGDEQEVRDILINTLEPCVNEITFDGLGSFVARKGNKGPKVAVVGHMDEVGFMVTHIDKSGFLRFTTIGGWWNQSMLNHRVTIRTHKGVKIPGVIGSVAPHALTEKQKQQPLSFDEMFIDIGANSREEAEKRGVEIGDFISPEANFACWGEDKVVGKALDNRIGCAMMAELLQTVNNPEITLYGVGSVEEEVGLRGAQTSAEHIKPDVVIVLDTAVSEVMFDLKIDNSPRPTSFLTFCNNGDRLCSWVRVEKVAFGGQVTFTGQPTTATREVTIEAHTENYIYTYTFTLNRWFVNKKVTQNWEDAKTTCNGDGSLPLIKDLTSATEP